MTVVIFYLGVVLLSLANGANDNFKGMATLWGGGVLSYRQGLALANIATLAGGVAAFVLGAGLLTIFSGKGIVAPEILQNKQFAASFALGAALTVIGATWLRYPVSTTHAIIGSLAGAAFAMPMSDPHYLLLVQKAFLPLLLSPLVAIGLTYIFWQVRGVLINARVVEVGVDVVECDGEPNQYENIGHIVSGFVVCFARGVNDTPKIASIWLLGSVFNFSALNIFIAIAAMMVIGSLLFSFQVARVMSMDITGMNGAQGFVGNFVTALLVLFASNFGLGVSTTHVSVGSLFGIGLVSGQAHWGKIKEIALAWLLTLPIGFGFAAMIVTLIGPII